MRSDKLTPKQTKFCYNFIKYEGNASEAYRKSYNVKKATDKTIWENACKLKKRTKVATRIMAIEQKMQKKLEITIDTQIRKLEDVLYIAMQKEELAPAIAAINSQSKHLGLIADKPATTVNINMIEAEKELRTVSPEARALMRQIIEGECEEIE